MRSIFLQALCTGSRNSLEDIACLMYIQGFVDGIGTGEGSKQKSDRLWCFPDEAAASQARLVVEKYMLNNPAALQGPAASIVGLAMAQAFPCKNAK